MSGTEFLFQYCDEKFTDEDLSPEGNAFAKSYYGENGLYLRDFADRFSSDMYVKPETDFNFKEFSKMLERRKRSGDLCE